MSQQATIVNHLKTVGPATRMELIRQHGILEVSARITELRGSGHDILTEMIEVGRKKRVARYHYLSGPKKTKSPQTVAS